MSETNLQRLLKGVSRRQRLVSLSTRLPVVWLGLSGVYLGLLLVSRLLGAIPPWFTPQTLAMVPAGALLLAVLFRRRFTAVDAARLVDDKTSAKDLFLTAALIRDSLGAYQALVLAQAERRAAEIRPAQVLRCPWKRGAATAAGSLLTLSLALFLLPQLDPFGRQQQRRRLAQQEERLRELREATALRASLLEQKAGSLQETKIDQAVADLIKTFNQAKPDDKTGTFDRLNEQQKLLGEQWREANAAQLRDALSRAAAAQNFGLNDPGKAQQWKQDLAKGDTSSVERELDGLKALAKKIGAASDSVQREGLRQEMMNRLENLRESLAQQMNSQALDAALQRALEQLQMACRDGAPNDSLEGLAESLNLTAEELRQLAEAAGDLKDLEAALKALQSAKRLHGVKPLDGSQCEGCQNPGDYAALFEAQYASACPGGYGQNAGAPGAGMGPGQGVGPRPHGDEGATTAFDPKKDPTAFQPGKILLSWKTREVSEPGQAREEFLQAVDAVSQQASEAILQERIPASYHGAVKSYFDALQHEATPPVER